MPYTFSLEQAIQLDRDDELASARKQFIIPRHHGREQIYFLGNSLGLQPRSARLEMDRVLDTWSTYGVEGFFQGEDPWMDYHDKLRIPLARIVGSLPEEVSVMNQLTVNLHLLLVSFYRPSGKRTKILCESKAFPSDQYMFETHLRHRGLDPQKELIELKPRPGEYTLRAEDVLAKIRETGEELALVLLGGINYYTGQVLDMAAITEAGQAVGAKVGFDLAHAAGNIPLSLHDWNVDFAAWCSYKYLNSGPGAVGGVFIHQRYHRDESIPRLAGWWGYEKSTRFKMEPGFKPIADAEGWQLSTPSLLLYAAHKAALGVVESAGWDRIQAKREKMTAWLWFIMNHINQSRSPEKRFQILTPEEPTGHGSQISLYFPENGRQVFEALTKSGIIADWREPGVIRIAPVPLYNSFQEVWTFGKVLHEM